MKPSLDSEGFQASHHETTGNEATAGHKIIHHPDILPLILSFLPKNVLPKVMVVYKIIFLAAVRILYRDIEQTGADEIVKEGVSL
jgi:hypothetical protein